MASTRWWTIIYQPARDAYEAALGSISDVWEADAALAPPWPELLSVLPHDRSRGLQTNADATAVTT